MTSSVLDKHVARRCVSLLLFLGLGSIAACSSGGLPTTHYYTLGPPQSLAAASAGASALDGLTVGIESFAVDPPYDQDRIVYRKGSSSSEVGFYAYHRWASPVGRLVQITLADGLRGTPGVASVEPAGSTTDYGARLSGRVLYLEDLDLPDGRRQARVAVEMNLRDGEGESLWSDTLEATADGRSGDAAEVAALLEQAFAAVVREARAGIAAAMDRR